MLLIVGKEHPEITLGCDKSFFKIGAKVESEVKESSSTKLEPRRAAVCHQNGSPRGEKKTPNAKFTTMVHVNGSCCLPANKFMLIARIVLNVDTRCLSPPIAGTARVSTCVSTLRPWRRRAARSNIEDKAAAVDAARRTSILVLAFFSHLGGLLCG